MISNGRKCPQSLRDDLDPEKRASRIAQEARSPTGSTSDTSRRRAGRGLEDVEASKTWSPAARAAARKAFAKATSSGASREEAIEAGYRAGLRREEKKPPPLPELAAYATSLLGARVVDVISRRRKIDPVEERCFERLFPDKGFPDRPAVVAVPQTPKGGRSESAPEDQKTTHEKALPGDPSPRQTGLGLE